MKLIYNEMDFFLRNYMIQQKISKIKEKIQKRI